MNIKRHHNLENWRPNIAALARCKQRYWREMLTHISHSSFLPNLVVSLLIYSISTLTLADEVSQDSPASEASATQVSQAAEAPVPEHYTVPFQPQLTLRTPASNEALEQLLPRVIGASVRIVGRPDEASQDYNNLARKRAINLRHYLERKGVPASSITVEVDTSSNARLPGGFFASHIYVTRPSENANPTAPAPAPAPAPDPAPAPAPAPPQAPSPAPAESKNDQLIRSINERVKSGRMTRLVANKLMQQMSLKPSATSAVTPEPEPSKTAAAPKVNDVAKPMAAAPAAPTEPTAQPDPTWWLDSNLTLNENINVWAKKSGLNPVVWDAVHRYQVTTTMPIRGTLPEVLRKVATSTGLQICTQALEKNIRVTDASAPCK